MSDFNSVQKKRTIGNRIGVIVSYIVFLSWTLITILPLVWMGYSSFKSNEELTKDIYAFPDALFDNKNDEYVVIPLALNVVPPWDRGEEDPEDWLILESTTIAPTLRLKVHFIPKENLPPEISSRAVGEKVVLNELPMRYQIKISWETIWFNYTSAFKRGTLGLKFINSIIYASIATFLIVLLGLMVSFGLTKLNFKKLSYVIGGLIGLGYLISTNAVIIPLFLMLSSVHLTNTHLGIILVYTAFGIPMSVMLASSFMSGLPDSLIESAYIDGASTMRMFFAIIVPMCVPVSITIAIINALGIWNEFLLVLVLATSEATKSLPVGVFSFTSLTSYQFGWQLAAMVIAVLPAMIIYFIFNKRLAKGVVAGAVKG